MGENIHVVEARGHLRFKRADCDLLGTELREVEYVRSAGFIEGVTAGVQGPLERNFRPDLTSLLDGKIPFAVWHCLGFTRARNRSELNLGMQFQIGEQVTQVFPGEENIRCQVIAADQTNDDGIDDFDNQVGPDGSPFVDFRVLVCKDEPAKVIQSAHIVPQGACQQGDSTRWRFKQGENGIEDLLHLVGEEAQQVQVGRNFVHSGVIRGYRGQGNGHHGRTPDLHVTIHIVASHKNQCPLQGSCYGHSSVILLSICFQVGKTGNFDGIDGLVDGWGVQFRRSEASRSNPVDRTEKAPHPTAGTRWFRWMQTAWSPGRNSRQM